MKKGLLVLLILLLVSCSSSTSDSSLPSTEIPVYEVLLEGGITKWSWGHYYSMESDVISYNGALLFQMPFKLEKGKKYAVIFDVKWGYLYDGSSLTRFKIGYTESSRAPLDTSQLSGVTLSEPVTFHKPASYPTVDVVDAPIVLQGENSGWCWAACMASILSYTTHIDYTCEEIATRYTTDTSQGCSMEDVRKYFKEDFGLSYKVASPKQTPVNVPTYAAGTVYSHGLPIGNHAVVICGLNKEAGIFKAMDPYFSGLCSGAILPDGTYVVVHAYSDGCTMIERVLV